MEKTEEKEESYISQPDENSNDAVQEFSLDGILKKNVFPVVDEKEVPGLKDFEEEVYIDQDGFCRYHAGEGESDFLAALPDFLIQTGNNLRWKEGPQQFIRSTNAQYEGMLTYVKSASDHIHGQIEAKEAEMKGYSLFAPERKTAKAEIKELTKQYEAQKAADLEQETLIKNYIKEVEKQLKTMKTDYPGVYGELETIEAKGMDVHLAFRVL